MSRALLLAAALAGCAELPRDPNGTTERVRREGSFRVGVIAGTDGDPSADAMLNRLASDLGARPDQLRGSQAEPLLLSLEERYIDIVFGRFDRNTPWAKRVHIVPISEGKYDRVAVALPPGENRWASLVEHSARAVRAP